ncbi:SRPBCC family protein [Pseudonocardia sp. RS010]|uniref:SRPBCC family protein n=1 Tax=Pseudonocardia sp. RS010 TaxID=3385979 RepID=UPI0039A015B2
MDLTATTTVRRSLPDVYAFWRLLENLPTFMEHLDEVRTTGERTSTWVASAPFDRKVEWDAVLIEDVANERIGWRSAEEAEVSNRGTVSFVLAPDGGSTEVHVHLVYDIPAGKLGKAVAEYFGEEPHQHLDDDLRRLKQVLEAGEVVRSDGAPWGKRARKEFPQRPAQPLTTEERQEVLGV